MYQFCKTFYDHHKKNPKEYIYSTIFLHILLYGTYMYYFTFTILELKVGHIKNNTYNKICSKNL